MVLLLLAITMEGVEVIGVVVLVMEEEEVGGGGGGINTADGALTLLKVSSLKDSALVMAFSSDTTLLTWPAVLLLELRRVFS